MNKKMAQADARQPKLFMNEGVIYILIDPVSQMMRFAIALTLVAGAAEAAPTFSQDVWPIVKARCIECHRAGEIAPMPFTSYKEVRPWSAAIREAVLSGAMPPWHAAHGTAHAFRNDRSLSRAETATLVAWADAGSPEGTPEVKRTSAYQPPAREDGWQLGKPDLVLKIPGFPVPKSGLLPYSFLIVPLHFDRDTWVSAAEFRIEHRAVVHHINAFVRAPGSSYLAAFAADRIFTPTVAERGKRRDGEKIFDRRELLLGYEPGYRPAPWLADGAKLIKAGSDAVFEMHYNPNGAAVEDYSEFALYFAKSAPVYRVVAIDTLRDLDLAIPAGDRAYISRASMTLARSARLLSIQPHMHFRGKSMEVTALHPDGTSERLLSVPKYDFQWQTIYQFKDPLELPAGTRLDSVATFDNSTNNPYNPDSSAIVRWGDQTIDEMHIAFLELVMRASTDPDLLFQKPPPTYSGPSRF